MYKFFTDASYCNKTKIGVISLDVYLNEILILSKDFKYQDIKNSELERIGINICLKEIEHNGITNYTIYSDCLSYISKINEIVNIEYIKGHKKLELMGFNDIYFRIVDKRSRKILRAAREKIEY